MSTKLEFKKILDYYLSNGEVIRTDLIRFVRKNQYELFDIEVQSYATKKWFKETNKTAEEIAALIAESLIGD